VNWTRLLALLGTMQSGPPPQRPPRPLTPWAMATPEVLPARFGGGPAPAGGASGGFASLDLTNALLEHMRSHLEAIDINLRTCCSAGRGGPSDRPGNPVPALGGLLKTLASLVPGISALQQGAGAARQTLTDPVAGATQGSSALTTAGLALAFINPAVGLAIAGIGTLGTVAFGSVEMLRSWSRELHNANLQFAEFSGAMARVEVEQFQREAQESRRRGDRRAGSARVLAEARRINDTLLFNPATDLVARIANISLAMLNNLITLNNLPVALGLHKLHRLLDKVEEIAGLKEPPGALGDSLRAQSQMHYKPWFPDHGAPERFKTP